MIHYENMSSSSSKSSLSKRSLNVDISSNPLDTLIPHFLASKRSLSTVEHVYKANDLCSSTRTALEKSATITARTDFLRSGVNSQLNVLHNVCEQSGKNIEVAGKEYQDVLESLDEAEKRLRHTLSTLEKTFVEAQLRPDGEKPRDLLDFVHKDGVEGLVSDIRKDVSQSQMSFQVVEKENADFENDVLRVKSHTHQETKSSEIENDPIDDSSIPDILMDMEECAKEMALNLESLVSHFDLCVTAIKHTEGGGDAAMRFTGDLPKGLDVGEEAVTMEPITDEQRADMMKVLEDDAGQVEEVVMEMKKHMVDIESLYRRVESYLAHLAKEQEEVNNAFRDLEQIGHRLPVHIARNQAFLARWSEQRLQIATKLEELDNAKGFYDGFLKAYDSLIIEVGRRKAVEQRRDKLIKDAMAKLETLHEEDEAEREKFRNEHGEVLPQDIWPGLLDAPTRFDITSVEGVVEKVPDISKSVIRDAIRRIHGNFS